MRLDQYFLPIEGEKNFVGRNRRKFIALQNP